MPCCSERGVDETQPSSSSKEESNSTSSPIGYRRCYVPVRPETSYTLTETHYLPVCSPSETAGHLHHRMCHQP